MSFAVRIAALLLMLVQGVGLCACRMDGSHELCLDDCAAASDGPDAGHGKPLDSSCNVHQQRLREARTERAEQVAGCVVPLLISGLSFVTADPALPFRHAASAAPPAPVGTAVRLPLLN